MIEFLSLKPELSMTLDGVVRVMLTAPKEHLQSLKALDGEKFDVALKKHRERRSLDANAYAWKLITEIANANRASKEDTYRLLLTRYGQSEMFSVFSNIDVSGYFKYYDEKGRGVVNGKEFTHYVVYKGSSDFDTREMSIFIDGIVDEARDLGIDTRTPDEIAQLKAQWGEEFYPMPLKKGGR